MALLNEINVKGVPHPIVTDDGYYQEMTVGDAEQLVATTFTEDDAPYNFRTAGGAIDIGDRKQVEGIVGGTVAWNQLVDKSKFWSQTESWGSLSNNSDGTATVTISEAPSSTSSLEFTGNSSSSYFKVPYGHKYIICDYHTRPTGFTYKNAYNGIVIGWDTVVSQTQANGYVYLALVVYSSVSAGTYTFCPQIFDLTQMFGSTIADYIYSLEQANAGAGVAWFRKYFPKPYYAYNAGELMSVKALRHITRGFNAWDGVQEQGIYDVSTGLPVANTSNYRNKNFIPVLPNTKYCYSNENAATGIRLCYYDADKNFITSRSNGNSNPQTFITPENAHYVTFYWADISKVCLNLSWDGERDGEYEEYVEHVYELDPDLELRGIPKLTAGNDLYYDGDIYEPDGTVTRRYKKLVLDGVTTGKKFEGAFGAVTNGYAVWLSVSDYNNSWSLGTARNLICNRFITVSDDRTSAPTYSISSGNGQSDVMVFILPNTITSVAEANTWLANNPTELVYLSTNTPTEETADSYNGNQIVDDFGTEEFVDAGVEAGTRDVAIPVGHNSLYQPNLRAKLEMAPESPEDNGYYVVYHHDGINEYVPLIIPQELPELPTEDGTYTLKCTVASGSAILSFESEV